MVHRNRWNFLVQTQKFSNNKDSQTNFGDLQTKKPKMMNNKKARPLKTRKIVSGGFKRKQVKKEYKDELNSSNEPLKWPKNIDSKILQYFKGSNQSDQASLPKDISTRNRTPWIDSIYPNEEE